MSKKQLQELNLIGHIEQVVEQSKGSKLSTAFYENVKPHTDYIGQKLELTSVQAVLISIFVNNSDDRRIELGDLCRHIDCTHITMIGLINDIDVLVANRSRQSDDARQFSVPNEFIDAIRKEVPYAPTQYTNLDTGSVFDAIGEILKVRDNGERSFQSLLDELARNYQFSGGEIENIARKRAVEVIIGGTEPPIATIHSYCQAEQIAKADSHRRIGY